MHSETIEPGGTEPYRQTVDEVVAALDTGARSGLSKGEARIRLERCGRNELAAEAPVPAWRKFLAQFTDVLVILLIVAALVSAGLWLYQRDTALPYEALAILAIVLLNALLGYFQQSRAEQAVAALREMSAAQASVVRDGDRESIPATELVAGDIILVEEGDTVPADARVIQSTALQTAEAALTGESLPVAKGIAAITGETALGDRHNMIFIFTPDAKTPLPYATRYDVTVDATAAAVSGRTLGAPYTFSFTTPTVKLLRTDAYRRGGRFDAPYVVLLRFNQPVDRADVAAALAAKFESHSWDQPSISAAAQQRLAAIDPTSVEPLQRQGCGDECGGLVHRAGDGAADQRLGQEAIPAPPDARGVRDRDPRSVAELGQAHTRSGAQVTRRTGDAGPGAGLHPQG